MVMVVMVVVRVVGMKVTACGSVLVAVHGEGQHMADMWVMCVHIMVCIQRSCDTCAHSSEWGIQPRAADVHSDAA